MCLNRFCPRLQRVLLSPVSTCDQSLFCFFLIEEQKRRLCLNRVNFLWSPQTSQSFLLSSLYFYERKHSFIDKSMIHNRTLCSKRTVIRPGAKLYPSNNTSSSIFLEYATNEEAKERFYSHLNEDCKAAKSSSMRYQ